VVRSRRADILRWHRFFPRSDRHHRRKTAAVLKSMSEALRAEPVRGDVDRRSAVRVNQDGWSQTLRRHADVPVDVGVTAA